MVSKALQQLWVHAVGLASCKVAWASTKLMKKQQWGNAGVEPGPAALCPLHNCPGQHWHWSQRQLSRP